MPKNISFKQKYRPMNIARFFFPLLGVYLYYAYNLENFALYFCISALIFSAMWLFIIEMNILVEENYWWSGYITLFLDISFIHYFIYTTGLQYSFLMFFYFTATVIHSLSVKNNWGLVALIYSLVGFCFLGILIILNIIPFVTIFSDSIKFNSTSFYFASFTLLVGNIVFYKIIRGIVLNNDHLLKEINQKNEKLQELDKAKTQFFANISHEFRTPLTLLISPLEAILQGEYGKKLDNDNDTFKSMLHNGIRLLKLINNLLDFTKIEAGRMSVNKMKTDIGELLQFYVSTVKSAAENKGLHIIFNNNADKVISCIDRDLIEKAVFNLISNAFKFTPSGKNIIVQLDSDEKTYKISVKDEGIGIPEDKYESIFERFGQIDGTSSRKYEGTGIGLALTKEISELHEGNIKVKSIINKGSTFTIELPIELDTVCESINDDIEDIHEVKSYLTADINYKKEIKEQTEEEISSVSDQTVLIVEDTDDMRTFLKQLLEKEYKLLTAENGKIGLEKIKSNKVDLVLSDVMMPEMDGYELTKAIKTDENLKGIPVILLTAKADILMKVEGLEYGADDYLSKPFNSKELRARIKSQLNMKSLRDAVTIHRDRLQDEVNKQMKTILNSEKLKQYLPPQLIESILNPEKNSITQRKSERKKLTVFFSDIVGFTSKSDRMESEDLTFLLNDYLTEMTKIVHKWGGTIDKFIGDAIMVYFGAFNPRGDTEEAKSCINMAIEMQKRMVELQGIWKHKGINQPFSIRCGINTGYCTIGNFGSEQRVDYTVIGGDVNLASRLESAAEEGNILVSESTKLLTEDHFEFISKGEISVKGISYPVKAFEVKF